MKTATAEHIKNINERKDQFSMMQRRFLSEVNYYGKILHHRPGQALMNALRAVEPDLYDIISGSLEFDCFYDDKKVDTTLAELGFDRKMFWYCVS